MLFNEPKLLKCKGGGVCRMVVEGVSVLFNEPKLLKSRSRLARTEAECGGFSALQRAEIAEI